MHTSTRSRQLVFSQCVIGVFTVCVVTGHPHSVVDVDGVVLGLGFALFSVGYSHVSPFDRLLLLLLWLLSLRWPGAAVLKFAMPKLSAVVAISLKPPRCCLVSVLSRLSHVFVLAVCSKTFPFCIVSA